MNGIYPALPYCTVFLYELFLIPLCNHMLRFELRTDLVHYHSFWLSTPIDTVYLIYRYIDKQQFRI